jgi:plasmid maintenance system antidote protein VapI
MAKPYRSLDDYFARTRRPQNEVAVAIGVSAAAMSTWRAHTAFPQSASMIVRLSDETGIGIEALVRSQARAEQARAAQTDAA